MKRFNWLSQAGLPIFIVIAIVHFYYVVTNAVNVPHMDEWDFFIAKYLSTNFSIKWLFDFHNEHRIVLTKLYTLILFRLNQLDISTQVILNFLFFIGMITSFVHILRKTTQVPLNLLWILFIPLLSPLLYENHLWGFQSQFHFFLFALIWSSYLFLRSSGMGYILGAIVSVLGIYSFSLGVICAMVMCAMFLYKKYITTGTGKEFWVGFAAVTITVISVLLWLTGFHKNPGHPDIIFPWDIRFCNYYINIVSLGFGVGGISFSKSLLSTFFAITVTALGLLKLKDKSKHGLWVPVTINVSILLALAFITTGRAGFGIEQAKSSRYAEISIFLFPTSLSILWVLLEKIHYLRAKYFVFVTALVILCFANNFNFSVYKGIKMSRIKGLKCIADFLDGKTERANCPNSYIADITEQVKVARDMGVSFTKTYKNY